MAVTPKHSKLKQGPLDVWSSREKLALACSVMRSGDQNWVSVSRAIKLYGEPTRPPDWFSQKNCALQYADLLEKVETPKRKRGDRGELETPGDQIVRILTIERIEELRRIIQEEQQKYKKMKRDVECIKSGQLDERLQEVWDQMQREKNAEAAAAAAAATPQLEKAPPAEDLTRSQTVSGVPKAKRLLFKRAKSTQAEVEGSIQEIVLDSFPSETLEDDASQVSLDSEPQPVIKAATLPEQKPKPTPPSSPLLSSLLQSKHKTADSLQQLKNEAEQEHAATQVHQLQFSPPVQPMLHTETPFTTTTVITTTSSSSFTTITQSSSFTTMAASAAVPVTKLHVMDTSGSLQRNQVSSSNNSVGGSDESSLRTICAAPTLSKLLGTPAQRNPLLSTPIIETAAVPIKTETEVKAEVQTKTVPVKEEKPVEPEPVPVNTETAELSTTEEEESNQPAPAPPPKPSPLPEQQQEPIQQQQPQPSALLLSKKEVEEEKKPEEPKEQAQAELEPPATPVTPTCSSGFINVDEEVSISFKEEPASPASSVSSKVSDVGANYRPRGRGRGRRPKAYRNQRRGRKPIVEEEKKEELSWKQSEAELSEEESARESDDTASLTTVQATASTAPSLMSDSIPNSPASLSHYSDTEDEKAYKTWKKSIMLVWRAAANHKYANVFLHPVTEEIAPGYRNVVHRPMDLSTIKKNIETGAIRTTQEFQRDMMLMFTNAVMYNSSDHNVYSMAMEMYDDVMQHIEQYVSTQLMVQTNEAKILRPSRRSENSDKEDDAKRRRTSSEQTQERAKHRKRKGHFDEG